MNRYNMEMVSLSSSEDRIDDFNFFICSFALDARSQSVSKLLYLNNTKIINFQFYDNKGPGLSMEFNEEIVNNGIKNVQCDINELGTVIQILKDSGISNDSKIAFDLTCFPKPFIFYIIKAFKELFEIPSIFAYYTEPHTYRFENGVYDKFISSSGSLSIHSIPGFTGMEKVGSEKILILLLGFDGGLASEIEIDIAPSQKYAVNGFPSYAQKFKDISLMANERLVLEENVKIKYARANNPFDVYNVLYDIKKNNQEASINVAPLGPKPMALGSCLFALHYSDVRILYPNPVNYKLDYSDSSWNSWKYKLDLFI